MTSAKPGTTIGAGYLNSLLKVNNHHRTFYEIDIINGEAQCLADAAAEVEKKANQEFVS